MKIVLTAKELLDRYPGVSDTDIQACFLELDQKPEGGFSHPSLVTYLKKDPYSLQVRDFDNGNIGSKKMPQVKAFNVWTSLEITPKNHEKFDLDKFKNRFEWYCAGWLDFFDKIVMKGEEDHEIRFEWGDYDQKAKKCQVTILIHPEYTQNPYYPPPPKK